jgi:hypothetical protein
MSTSSSAVSTKPAARPVASTVVPSSHQGKVLIVGRGECGHTTRTMIEPYKLEAARRWGHKTVCYGD